jgi:hypothetical protein
VNPDGRKTTNDANNRSARFLAAAEARHAGITRLCDGCRLDVQMQEEECEQGDRQSGDREDQYRATPLAFLWRHRSPAHIVTSAIGLLVRIDHCEVD